MSDIEYEFDDPDLEALAFQGISIDLAFPEPRPVFGDLFAICDREHPHHPPSGNLQLHTLADLGFDQVDDYFGIESESDEGDDVVVWLYPLVGGEPVYHHLGPYDAIRLEYNVLRNLNENAERFLSCVQRFAKFAVAVHDPLLDRDLGCPPNLAVLRADIDRVIVAWAERGIEVGSSDALEIDF